ncbi:MAG: hypothetical protein AB7I33_13305 [Gemmatimonadales bacterium]
MGKPGSRAGTALLEAIVALAILATAGLSMVTLVNARVREGAGYREREAEVDAASRVLTAMTLLKREDLDIRLGTRQVGEFRVEVQRPRPTLYRIAIGRADRPGVEELVTVVYRSER